MLGNMFFSVFLYLLYFQLLTNLKTFETSPSKYFLRLLTLIFQSVCQLSVLLFPPCLILSSLSCVFQSGRSPSSSEWTLPAHVSTGRVCGQELHPIQNQTSLKNTNVKHGFAWPGLAQPQLSKALFTAPGFSRTKTHKKTKQHFNDNFPSLHPSKTISFTASFSWISDPDRCLFSLSNWSQECSTHRCGWK